MGAKEGAELYVEKVLRKTEGVLTLPGANQRETHPTEKMDLSFALKRPAISDARGLKRLTTYEAPGSTYTYGDTMFIAGTKGTPLVFCDGIQNY